MMKNVYEKGKNSQESKIQKKKSRRNYTQKKKYPRKYYPKEKCMQWKQYKDDYIKCVHNVYYIYIVSMYLHSIFFSKYFINIIYKIGHNYFKCLIVRIFTN